MRGGRQIETADTAAQMTGDTVLMGLVIFMIMFGNKRRREDKTQDSQQVQADDRSTLPGKLRS